MLQIALEKFKAPTVGFAPQANTVWLDALRRVVTDVKRLRDHPDRMLLRGYALPDPHAFLNTTNRLAMYTACWLMIRPRWINLATNRHTGLDGMCSPYPEPQDWKDFLSSLFVQMGLTYSSSSSLGGTVSMSRAGSSAPPGRQNRQKRRRIENEASRSDKFNLDTSGFLSPTDVFWRGKLLFTKDALRSNKYNVIASVATEVVWELFNSNFALEVLATDRVIFPRNKMTDYEALERDATVSECFPDSVLVGLNYPTVDKGLGALHWRDRIEYVEAFRSLLSTWGGDMAPCLASLPAVVATSLEQYVREVERLAYGFYCQMFFDYFGRAPCVPCQLPKL